MRMETKHFKMPQYKDNIKNDKYKEFFTRS